MISIDFRGMSFDFSLVSVLSHGKKLSLDSFCVFFNVFKELVFF